MDRRSNDEQLLWAITDKAIKDAATTRSSQDEDCRETNRSLVAQANSSPSIARSGERNSILYHFTVCQSWTNSAIATRTVAALTASQARLAQPSVPRPDVVGFAISRTRARPSKLSYRSDDTTAQSWSTEIPKVISRSMIDILSPPSRDSTTTFTFTSRATTGARASGGDNWRTSTLSAADFPDETVGTFDPFADLSLEELKEKVAHPSTPPFKASRMALERRGLRDDVPALTAEGSAYRGDMNSGSFSAQKLDLPDKFNCALWLLDIPVGVTYHEIFCAVKTGAVFALHISPEDDDHERQAAKIVFSMSHSFLLLICFISHHWLIITNSLFLSVSGRRPRVEASS